jgi:hypothetical protein
MLFNYYSMLLKRVEVWLCELMGEREGDGVGDNGGCVVM